MKSPRKICRIGLIQTPVSEDPSANLKKTLLKIKEAAARKAKIICLQELFRTRYFCQGHDARNFDLAEPVPGPTTRALSKAARQAGAVIIAPIFERRARGVYHNSAAVIDADGSLLGLYRKMHIPDDPFFYEKFYFTPGDLGFKTFKTRYGKIGVLICWDQWFPEAARLTALSGAGIIFYPTAIGAHDSEPLKTVRCQLEGWQIAQRGHAVANAVFVAAANRVGREGPVKFWGHSFVADPFGAMIAEAGEKDAEVLIADCDLSRIEETRRSWPFLRDRRVDAYPPLLSRFLE